MRGLFTIAVVALVAGLGAAPSASAVVTHLASRGVGGVVGNSLAVESVVSESGKVVAFSSRASNLVPGDVNDSSDAFIRTIDAGGAEVTERISVSSAGVPANLDSEVRAINASGRYVVFLSDATNLVPNDTNGQPDLFLRDRVLKTTERVNVSSDEQQATKWAVYPLRRVDISGDGSRIVFGSDAPNLVPLDTNNKTDVFLRDVVAGTTTRVSVTSNEVQAQAGSNDPQISSDGRIVSFGSSTNLGPGDYGGIDVYARDLEAGTTELISTGVGGIGNGLSSGNSIDHDGGLIAFNSQGTNLVAGDTNGVADIFVRNRVTKTTTRVSKTSTNKQLTQATYLSRLSADGSTILFLTKEPGVAPNVPGNVVCSCVYRRSVVDGVEPTSGVSLSYDNAPRDVPVVDATLELFDVDADASVVIFSTQQSALPIDKNIFVDVYARITGY